MSAQEAEAGGHRCRRRVLPCEEEGQHIVHYHCLVHALPALGVPLVQHELEEVAPRPRTVRGALTALPDHVTAGAPHECRVRHDLALLPAQKQRPQEGRAERERQHAAHHGIQRGDERVVLAVVKGAKRCAQSTDCDGLEGHLRHPAVDVHNAPEAHLTLQSLHEPVGLLCHERQQLAHTLDGEGGLEDVVRDGPLWILCGHKEEA
mmetsp:Transcript_89385/g.208096  ORF Transcript_89385/g.208096 Transcript_89385/m.208096 type:complete len:206 (-) Transcript_89385:423-1040(-)